MRLGCVGEAPGSFWMQAVAHTGTKFDLAGIERVALGTDGEAQYVNGAAGMRFGEVRNYIDPFHVTRAVARCARPPESSTLVAALRERGPQACAGEIDALVEAGAALRGAEGVAAYLRAHAAEIGGGPSLGTMESEQQHMYKSRMGSFPCAWSREGADAMARVRSWIGSGYEVLARTREESRSRARSERRDRRLAAFLDRRAGGRVESEGKGWEYPHTASLDGFRADARYEGAGRPLG